MRYRGEWGFQLRITPAVKYLIIACTILFIADMFFRPGLSSFFGLRPALFWSGALWQPVTYLFLHSGLFHLLINMFILWMFGATLESTWGTRRFVKFYFLCGIGAGVLNAAVTPGSPIPTVGASGAIYGLLMAFGILFPNQLIYVWGVFPVKAKYFVIGIGVIEFLTAMSASRTGIAHFAHLGGMLFGLLYLKWDRLSFFLRGGGPGKRPARHLRVVRDRTRERERLQQEVDRLLDKINREGVGSLTRDEENRLRTVSRKLTELDEEDL